MIWLLMAVLAAAVLWLGWQNRAMGRRLKSLQNASEAERNDVRRMIAEDREKATAMDGRVKNLEAGIVPDFEEAKTAVNAVNEFNRGLSSIMGYDPMEAARKRREENGG